MALGPCAKKELSIWSGSLSPSLFTQTSNNVPSKSQSPIPRKCLYMYDSMITDKVPFLVAQIIYIFKWHIASLHLGFQTKLLIKQEFQTSATLRFGPHIPERLLHKASDQTLPDYLYA